MLHSYSKAYIKRELNNCKGETQHVPIKRLVYCITCFLLFIWCLHPFTFSPFQPFTSIPGEVRRGCTSQEIAWKRLKSAFGNKSIGGMGIISYPQFALQLLSNRNFFNVWEHFRFSLFLTINIFNIEKDFRLFCPKIGLKIPKYRFCNPKA